MALMMKIAETIQQKYGILMLVFCEIFNHKSINITNQRNHMDTYYEMELHQCNCAQSVLLTYVY